MRLTRRSLNLALTSTVAAPLRARAAAAIRVSTLRFGSLAWELDTLRRHDPAVAATVHAQEAATGPASLVALQAGQADLALQDWLWVSRQRASGAHWTCAPVPAALGGVLCPPDSPIRTLADLRGKRLGIAGGPLDKSWLLLRAFAQRSAGFDPDASVVKSFGPPPLISQLLEVGRLDAVLTYWPFAARGEAAGWRTVLPMADVLAGLGAPRDMPMLGFVFDERWAAQNRAALTGFLAGMQGARQVLERSDAAWTAIAPLTGATSEAELERLRDWYRRGFPGTWDEAKRQAAGSLFRLMAALGGEDLVGSATELAPGTFWDVA